MITTWDQTRHHRKAIKGIKGSIDLFIFVRFNKCAIIKYWILKLFLVYCQKILFWVMRDLVAAQN
jgi:hypothetical protein